jgi:ATP-binding cassette subfamily C protein CydC
LPALALAGGLLALPWLAGLVARRLVDAPAAEAAARLSGLKALVTDQLAAAAEIAVYGLAERVSADVMAQAAALDATRARMVRGEAWLAGVLVAAGPVLAAAVAGLAAASSAGAAQAALAALAAAGGAEAQAALVRARGRDAALADARGRLDGLNGPEGLAGAEEATPVGEALEIEGRVLAPGGRLGIVGVSGRGKTRLLETLAGWRADAPQALMLGGVAVQSLEFGTLSGCFALVPQAPVLIAGSVADNLRLAAAGLSEAALWAALEVACLADDVRAMPDGLTTWLGEGAGQLSGGQRKRLALARALLAGRPWLLLDEPSEGLDADTEAEMVRRLGDWLDQTGAGLGTGVIVASHRAAPLGLAADVMRL